MKLVFAFRAASITTAANYAVAGIGFALATVVMGRTLDREHFSIAVLIIALCNIGAATAAAGLNGVVVRHDLRADRRLLAVACTASLSIALVAAAVGYWTYRVTAIASLVLFLAVLAGGITLTVKSSLQRAQAFQRAAFLSQSANGGLLIASTLMLLGIGRVSWFPTLVVSMVFAVVGVAAWRWAMSEQRVGGTLSPSLWRDVLHFGGLVFAGELMVQVERVVIPLRLGIDALALYAVVAAVALAPYRVLELGVGTTLAARLRASNDIAARRRLVRRDVVMLAALSLLGGVLLVWLAPYVCREVLPGSEFPRAWILAAAISGSVRVAAAVTLSLAAAFCSPSELRALNATGWLCLGIAAAGGYFFASLGLAGLIYGVAIGWLARSLLAYLLARRHFGQTIAGDYGK